MGKGRAVVLLSGGIDSATTLYYARKRGYVCLPLIFDYGQRHKREIKSARDIAGSLNLKPTVMRIKFPWKGSSLLDKKMRLPGKRNKGIPNTYVPGRNTVFLSYALSYAESIRAKAIFIGAHSEDYSGYPDCRAVYFDAFRILKNLGTEYGARIKVYTPLIKMKKKNIISLGRRLKVPFQYTWSCYSGGKRPCGKCDSCYYRAKGFREAKLVDPLVEEEGHC